MKILPILFKPAMAAALWDSINAKRDGGIYAWSDNPWVAVYEFTHHKCNVDRMEVVA